MNKGGLIASKFFIGGGNLAKLGLHTTTTGTIRGEALENDDRGGACEGCELVIRHGLNLSCGALTRGPVAGVAGCCVFGESGRGQEC